MKKPRDIAFDRLAPHQAAVVSYSAPLEHDEDVIVITAKGVNVLQLQRDVDKATITNPTDEEVAYFFVIAPKVFIALINADWRAFRAFVESLQQNLLH
jgi:hypothetical protein